VADSVVPGHTSSVAAGDHVALVELVNRVVDRGVVLGGDLTISVADVDLLYVGLRLLLCSPDRLVGSERTGAQK
jgi:hypothetical protein